MGYSLFIFVCIICFLNVHCISIPCGETYLAENGYNCYPCHAGHYKKSDCYIDRVSSICEPCPYGTFMPTCDNSPQCKTCDLFCGAKQIEYEQCTTTENLKCQCKAGFYWIKDPNVPNEGHCTEHTKCKKGEGVKKKGTPYEDTQCEPCINGSTFSDSVSVDVCTPCTVCNITLRQCNVTRDAKCDSTPDTPEGDGGMSTWTIVAIVVSVVVPIVAVIILVCLYRKRNKCINHDKSTIEYASDRIDQHVSLPQAGRSSDSRMDSSQQNDNGTCTDRLTIETETDSSSLKTTQELETHYLGGEKSTNKIASERDEVTTKPSTKNEREGHNVANDVSYQKGTDTDSLSIDAGPVAPRKVQIVSSSIDNADMKGKEDESTLEAGCSRSNENAAETQQNGSNVQTVHDTQRHRSTFENEASKFWFEVFSFISQNMTFDDFKMFYRRLIVETDNEALSTIEADIDHARQENKDTKEALYQLMKGWRKKHPEATTEDLFSALDKCKFRLLKERLTKFVDKL